MESYSCALRPFSLPALFKKKVASPPRERTPGYPRLEPRPCPAVRIGLGLGETACLGFTLGKRIFSEKLVWKRVWSCGHTHATGPGMTSRSPTQLRSEGQRLGSAVSSLKPVTVGSGSGLPGAWGTPCCMLSPLPWQERGLEKRDMVACRRMWGGRHCGGGAGESAPEPWPTCPSPEAGLLCLPLALVVATPPRPCLKMPTILGDCQFIQTTRSPRAAQNWSSGRNRPSLNHFPLPAAVPPVPTAILGTEGCVLVQPGTSGRPLAADSLPPAGATRNFGQI